MRAFWSSALVAGLVLQALIFAVPVSAQSRATCADYDAWEWAQSVFDNDPRKFSALDPDNDGIACPDLPQGGFAPAFWTDRIPANVEQGKILRIIDGDTFEVEIGGVSNRVRIYRADTPETQNKQECGGQQATDFATWVLSWNDKPGIIYIEKDKTSKDKYGRELAYLWFTIDGKPYMLNHILVNNGFAQDKDYGDRKYDSQMKDAAGFAKRHDIGVWGICGGFEIPLAQAPAVAQPSAPQAPVNVDAPVVDAPVADAPVVQEPVYEAPAPQEPAYQEPVYEEPAPAPDTGGCDPNYVPCVPLVNYDLDCGDIGFGVQVVGGDPHGFDRDNDGYGCESYG